MLNNNFMTTVINIVIMIKNNSDVASFMSQVIMEVNIEDVNKTHAYLYHDPWSLR